MSSRTSGAITADAYYHVDVKSVNAGSCTGNLSDSALRIVAATNW